MPAKVWLSLRAQTAADSLAGTLPFLYEMAAKEDLSDEAARILKAELARKDITYKRLALLLGSDVTEKQLSMRINRGSFSFSFFVRVMRAIGTDKVDVSKR